MNPILFCGALGNSSASPPLGAVRTTTVTESGAEDLPVGPGYELDANPVAGLTPP